MQIWIDVEDSAGNKLGDGPIVTATGWQNEPQLDLAGRFSFSMPATDPRAALIQEKRIARCFLADGNGVRECGAGIIDQIDRAMSAEGGPMLTVSGPDILHELAYRGVGRLMLREQRWTAIEDKGAVWYIRTDPVGETHLGNAYDDDPSSHAEFVLDHNEWLYIGYDARFHAASFDVRTRNGSTCTLQYQYYASEGWKDLPNLSDGTLWAEAPFGPIPFDHSGIIFWDEPDDWERCTPTPSAGSWFWVRFRAISGDTDEISIRSITLLADFPTTDGLAQIMAYAPPGWTLDAVNGYTTTATEAYMAFAGESVLTALQRLASDRGEHFRLGAGRTIIWLRDDAPLASVRAVAAGDPMAAEGHDELCLIQRATEHRDASGLMTRIIPYGAGMGGTRTTLAATTRTAPAGYTLSRAGNYIRADAAELCYGQIERQMQFWHILPQQGDSRIVHPEMAANELFDAALAALQDYCAPIVSHDWQVVKLATRLYPGQTMHGVYQEWRDGVQVADIDTYRDMPLYIMGLTESVGQDGVFVTGLQLASVRRRPETDASAVVGAIQDVRGAVATGADGGGTLVLNIKGTTDADTVDHIHASATPMPGMLLPLGLDGKFPAEALPSSDLSDAAGAGLIWDGTAFNVVAGTGIVVSGDAVALNTAANLLWTGDHTFQGNLTARHILPEANDAYDLGSSARMWRRGWFSELDTVRFAEHTAALIGGWLVIPHGSGTLAADVAETDTEVDFGQAMTPGDFVILRSSAPAVEYMQVGALIPDTEIVNLLPNPSVETNLVSWAFTGDGTGPVRERSAGAAWVGDYGLRWVMGSSPSANAYTNQTTPTIYPSQGAAYTASVRVRGVGTAIGKQVRIGLSEIGGAQGAQATYGLWTPLDGNWQTLTLSITVAQVDRKTLRVTLFFTGAAAGDELHIDGWQLEQASSATGYCDGDQPDCGWSGTAHNSPSWRLVPGSTTYSVSRDLDGSGANVWPAGTAYLVLGQEGDGRIELDAQSGGPRISVLLQGDTYAEQDEVVRIGSLLNAFGVSDERYGFGVGDYAARNFLRYEPDEGFLLSGGGGTVAIDGTGILVGYDATNGLRFAADEDGTIHDRIYHAADVDALHIESATNYWQLAEQGGAKLAMDGGFLKLQARAVNHYANLGIGDVDNNYAMLQVDWTDTSYPELRVCLGSGAEPPEQFRFVKDHTNPHHELRVMPICHASSEGSTTIILIDAGVTGVFGVVGVLRGTVTNTASGLLRRPESGTASFYCGSSSGNYCYVELTSTGRLRLRFEKPAMVLMGILLWY